MTTSNCTYTLTFSESVENHKGMQIIGNISSHGFSEDFVKKLSTTYNGELISLHQDHQPEAYLCIFRKGVSDLFQVDTNALFSEQQALEKDTKALMRGRLVNKRARYNLCFADFDQKVDLVDISQGKGTVVNFNRLPHLNQLRTGLELFGPECKLLNAEGNYYYDIRKTYIGWHGDTERKKVIGVRLGSRFPLHFRWHYNSFSKDDRSYDYRREQVGSVQTYYLDHGDVYMMSEKATGFDTKKANGWSLCHAAGDLKLFEK